MTKKSINFFVWIFLLCACINNALAENASEKVHLFILSGQSNMVGLDPNTTFIPALQNAFPKDQILVVKFAKKGQSIRRWTKNPTGSITNAEPGGPMGDFYDILMRQVKSELKGKNPDTVTLIWMQGERDARLMRGDQYAEDLRRLINNIKADLNLKDINFVVGRLSDFNMRRKHGEWEKVRSAQMEVAESDPRGAWVNTDDLNGDKNDLHYTEEGYRELGRRFAQKAIELIQKNAN